MRTVVSLHDMVKVKEESLEKKVKESNVIETSSDDDDFYMLFSIVCDSNRTESLVQSQARHGLLVARVVPNHSPRSQIPQSASMIRRAYSKHSSLTPTTHQVFAIARERRVPHISLRFSPS